MGNNNVAKPFQYRGKWRITVTLPNRTRVTCGFDTCADAAQWGTDQMAKASTETAPALGGPNQATLAQALDHYARIYSLKKWGQVADLGRINRYLAAAGMPLLEAIKTEQGDVRVRARTGSESVPASFQKHLGERRLLRSQTNTQRDALAAMPCSHISPRILAKFQAAMVEEGLSESSARKELALLKAVFKVAVRDWTWLRFDNPCAMLKLGKSKQRFVKFDAAQREALGAALAECANPYLAPFVFMVRHTTLCRKALLDLRWSDVDLGDRSSLAVTESGQWLYKFPRPVVEVLLQMPKSPCGRIFPMSASAVTQDWNRVRARANLLEPQFRDVRHIDTADGVRRGLTGRLLSQVMGHSPINTAQAYVSLMGENVASALDAAMENGAPL